MPSNRFNDVFHAVVNVSPPRRDSHALLMHTSAYLCNIRARLGARTRTRGAHTNIRAYTSAIEARRAKLGSLEALSVFCQRILSGHLHARYVHHAPAPRRFYLTGEPPTCVIDLHSHRSDTQVGFLSVYNLVSSPVAGIAARASTRQLGHDQVQPCMRVVVSG